MKLNRKQKFIGLLVLAGGIAALLIHLHNYSLHHFESEPIGSTVMEGIRGLQSYYNPLIVVFTVVGIMGSGLYLIHPRRRKNTLIVSSAFLYPLLAELLLFMSVFFAPLALVPFFAPFYVGLPLYFAIHNRHRTEIRYLSVALAHNLLYVFALVTYIGKSWEASL